MEKMVNRQFRLKRRPVGRVQPTDFDLVETRVPEPGPGEVLVRVLYLSIDPTQRIWMDTIDQYMPPVAIGEVMRGGGIGRVIASQSPKFQVGDLVTGSFGWQDFCCLAADDQSAARVVRVPGDLPIPLPAMLGVCGLTGLTAFFGLTEVAVPKPGETVVVSAAAGAVGSVAAQIAKLKGCRTVGIAGGPRKCAWLTDQLGLVAAVDYKQPDWRDALADATPGGVDVDFENVGGDIMEAVMGRMNIGGRMALCGMISRYNECGSMPANFAPILMRRIRVQGFIVIDYLPRFAEGAKQLAQWVIAGQIKHRETIVDGLEHAPAALNRLFDGDNIGKLMVKVADPAVQ